MSYYDYEQSKRLRKGDPPFYGLIMAAMRKADDDNLAKLKLAWPMVYQELQDRYWASGGILPGDMENA